MLEAETPSEAESYSGKALWDWRVNDSSLVTFGVDAEKLDRDATRTRKMLSTGKTFTDHIWPDVSSENVGAFAELDFSTEGPGSVKIGARIDNASSDANAADDMITLGPGNTDTIRNRYAEIYGDAARDTDRSETMFSGNILFEYAVDETIMTYIGVGRTERYPNQTELYFAFAPAPGGYLVGDPSLETEKKHENM